MRCFAGGEEEDGGGGTAESYLEKRGKERTRESVQMFQSKTKEVNLCVAVSPIPFAALEYSCTMYWL